MKNQLITLGALIALTAGTTVNGAKPIRADFHEYVKALSERPRCSSPMWQKGTETGRHNIMRKAQVEPERTAGPISYWGSLNTPEGAEWMYSCEYTYGTSDSDFQTIESALITIYDASLKSYAQFTANFELEEHETSINSVQVSPVLSRKFFNINDSYEVMVYVHATTDDYTGHAYTQVYTLKDGSMVSQIEGDCIASINTATDSWSEKFTMVFMRDETLISDEDYQYTLYFDVYSKAGWSTGCQLEHTFVQDYALIAGAGNYALPLLVNTYKNQAYYALPRYEKPYFLNSWTEDITPDNHFLIDLYNDKFELVKTTSIPMDVEGTAAFSFPGLGELNGFDDLSFGVFTDTDDPVYVVGVENYMPGADDFTTSIYVYNAEGERLSTFMTDVSDYLQMSDLPGEERQFCLYRPTEDGGFFDFINFPSGRVSASIDVRREGSSISTTLDRVAAGTSYKYVSSLVNGFVDKDDNIIHKLAWFDADGTFERYSDINLGQDIVMAMPYVAEEALNPYLFDTSDEHEYMFLVKKLISPESSRTQEILRVYNEQSEVLLELGPDEASGKYLSSIFLTNVKSTLPKLMVVYSGPEGYLMDQYSLPFTKFRQGEGTKANPYLISSAGELRTVQQAPGAYYALACDIDMQGTPWEGNKCDFTGEFDGQGHTISNLNINGHGIFRSILNGAKLGNLNISGVKIAASEPGGVVTGTLGGGDSRGSTISNVHINGVSASGDGDVTFGGIAGDINLNSTISDCSVLDADLCFGNRGEVGGIVGRMSTGSTVANTLFEGRIEAQVAGGIAGESTLGDETISNCHAHVDISAASIAGGIIGYSSRSAINNCYVDGAVKAIGTRAAHSGGIAGEIKSNYSDEHPMIITNCIVAAEVSANEEANEAIAHRVAGFTSGDEMLVDWESKDPNVNWEDPSTYPYIPGSPESSIGPNYALGIDKIDADVPDDAYKAEGQTIAIEDLTDEFLSAHHWAMGSDAENPWKADGSALALYYETFDLTPSEAEIKLTSDAEDSVARVTFTSERRYASNIEIAVTAPEVAEIIGKEISADGKSVVCTVAYVGEGLCTITATLGKSTAECKVVAVRSSIEGINAEAAALIIDGAMLKAAGSIRVYNIAGMLVAEGTDTLSISSLPSGAYIAENAGKTLKFVK